MRNSVRFEFSRGTERDAVETQLARAITAAECTFGQAQVRLDAAYLFSDDGRRLVLDASSDVGEYVARLFTGLLIREIGEDRFSVERVEKVAEATCG